MSEITHIAEQVRCPICGRRMWMKDPGYYGCKEGHTMAADAMQAPADRPIVVVQPNMHWPWWKKAEIPWAIAALLLVAQIVEVLTWI